MDRRTRRATTFTRRSLVALAAVAAAAAVLTHADREGRAATPPLTLKTIAIDGGFSDWDAVLANAGQTTRDGDGSSSYLTVDNCTTLSMDRDCPQRLFGGAGNDFVTFAWTYDPSAVYLYIERFGSTTNGVDFLFVADVDRTVRLDGSDRVVHVSWAPANGSKAETVTMRKAAYVPSPGNASDPIRCEAGAGNFCTNRAGLAIVPNGSVDGFMLAGSMGTETACTGCAGKGSEDGKRLEIAVPWSVFDVTSERPFYWHVVSSNNGSLGGAIDNIGAPGGGLGSFLRRGVALGPDRIGSLEAPGSATYVHTLTNTGNDSDTFDLAATSSFGAKIEILEGGIPIATDLTGDGVWESVSGGGARPTVTVGPGLSQDVTLRVTVDQAGVTGQDVTLLTAASTADPTVTASARDTTWIGTSSFDPERFERWVVAGHPVEFRESLRNGDSSPRIFDLSPGPGCSGYAVELARDGGTAPGAVVAADLDGDGQWDPGSVDSTDPTVDADGNGLPDLGPLAGLATRTFYLRVVPPAGTADGTSCTLALRAGTAATVQHAITVAPPVSFEPEYRGSTPGAADAQDERVATGGFAFFPGVVRNAEGTPRVYDLSASTSGAGAAAPRIWSDPNGDGNPSDGRVIAQTDQLAGWGGAQHVVVEARAGTAALATLLVTTATATAVEGGATDSQVSEAIVGHLATFADDLHTDGANVFAPCSTVYVKGSGLAPSNATRYALEWLPPSGTLPAISPWPTTIDGTAEASLALGAASAGPWNVRLTDSSGPDGETVPFQVQLDAVVAALSTDRPRYLAGETVMFSASLHNRGAADLDGTVLTYDGHWSGFTPRVRSAVDVPAGATVEDAFSFTLAGDQPLGNWVLSLSWDLSCGPSGLPPSYAVFQVVPLPPSISAPTGLTADATPTISGTGLPGATVTITVTDPSGARTAGVTADATTGAFSWTVPDTQALSEGAHSVTATQTASYVTSDPSAAASFTVDTVPPAIAPVLLHPVDGSATNAVSVAVDGTAADPDAVRVEVLEMVGGNPVPLGAFDVVAGTPGTFAGTVTLASGAHELRARALDAAGNASVDSAAIHVTVDLDPPLAATDLWPADGALLGSALAGTGVDATGTAEEGATVHVVLRDAVTSDVLLEADAARTGTPPTSFRAPLGVLADGRYALTVTVTDAAGNGSPAAVATFAIDTAVAPPAFTAPAAGATLNGSQAPAGAVTVSGTAEPGASVTVSLGAGPPQTLTADASTGAWSTAFQVGDTGVRTALVASAAQTDLAGNGSASSSVSFDVDTRTLAPAVSSPVAGAVLDVADAPARAVPVSGTTEDGAAVHLAFEQVGTGALVEIDATVAGTSFSTNVTLPADGVYRLTASATDAAGNARVSAGAVQFTLDTVSDAPAVLSPAPNAILNLADTPAGVVVSGTAEVGATVTVTIGTAVETAVATTGAWSVTFAALADGSHALAASAVDASGNPPSAETQVAFSLDRTPPPAPSVTSPSAGPTNAPAVTAAGTADPAALVRVTLRDRDTGALLQQVDAARSGLAYEASLGALAEGRYELAVAAIDAAGNASATSVAFDVDRTVLPPAFTAPAAGATLNGGAAPGGAVTVSGTAEPGASVTVTLGSTPQTLAADASTGAWSTGFSAGDTGLLTALTVTATQTDRAGNASGLASRSFDLDTRTLAPSVSSPSPNATLNLAQTPDGVVVSGTAEAGATVTVAIGGAVRTVPAASGSWSATFAGLGDGAHEIVATAVDAAANARSAEVRVPFSLDRTPPSAPSVTSPASGPTNAAQVVVAGTATAGDTVVILVDGVEAGTASPDANGDFSATVSLPSGDGAVVVTAVVRDAAGNLSDPSAAVSLDVDRTAPPAPTVESPLEGAAFAPGPVEVHGHAEAGAHVTVTVAGASVEATAGPDGAFTATISVPEGTQTISVQAADAAGNESPAAQVSVTARTTSGSGGGGCGCGQGSAAPGALALLALLALAPRRRRA